MSEIKEIQIKLFNQITQVCNKVGCKDCPDKWDRDEDGNACLSDWLQMREQQCEDQS